MTSAGVGGVAVQIMCRRVCLFLVVRRGRVERHVVTGEALFHFRDFARGDAEILGDRVGLVLRQPAEITFSICAG
jgi:hypothetical protein